MTLILTHVSTGYPYVLQVTDRLVTRDGRAFDSLANKNLVFVARNAIVAIAYSGLAYLDGVPTDIWMAERLAGKQLSGNDRFAFSSQAAPALDLGQAEILLRTELMAAFSRLNPRLRRDTHTHDLVIAGWQFGRRPLRPIVDTIEYSRPSGSFEIRHRPRYWHLRAGPTGKFPTLTAAAPGANISRDGFKALSQPLMDAPPDEAERILVETIRKVALIEPRVGPHCMSILMPPPRLGWLRVRFLPLVPHQGLIVTKEHSTEVPVAYTPWILSPWGIMSPSTITGGMPNLQVGPLRVNFESMHPLAPGRPMFGMSSQERPSPP